MEKVKYFLWTVFFTAFACSDPGPEDQKLSSSDASSGQQQLSLAEAQELMDELQQKTAINIIRDKVVMLPNTPTVLEQHNKWYGVEAQKATGSTLENYLAWVRCYQGLQYVGRGLYHPLDIGNLISRLGKLNPDIKKSIYECARQQPPLEQDNEEGEQPELVEIEKNEQTLNLGGWFFNYNISSKTTRIINTGIQEIAFSSTSENYLGQSCYDLDEPIAHYAASLNEGHCVAVESEMVQEAGLEGWPFYIQKAERKRLGPTFSVAKNWYDENKISSRKSQPEAALGLQGSSD